MNLVLSDDTWKDDSKRVWNGSWQEQESVFGPFLSLSCQSMVKFSKVVYENRELVLMKKIADNLMSDGQVMSKDIGDNYNSYYFNCNNILSIEQPFLNYDPH